MLMWNDWLAWEKNIYFDMIWMWGPTSPTLISFFTLHLSWHPGSCFSSRATFYHLSPWRQSGSHQKSEWFTQSNHFISTPQLCQHLHVTYFGGPFWQFLPNPDEDAIINDAKFALKYLMVDTELQQISVWLPITVHSSPILQFRLVRGNTESSRQCEINSY